MSDDAEAAAGPTIARRTRPLSEDGLDDLAGRIGALPEPVAALAVGVEVARAEGDATGVRKRLFELGIGVVRYAVSVGLAVVAARLGSSAAPKPLADALRRAARLSDGQWCDLARTIAGALKSLDPKSASMLAFTTKKPLAELVSSRNDFIHRGGPGDDALDATLAVLDAAGELLALPVRVVATVSPSTFETRVGTPVRAGVWRKTPGAVPPSAERGEAYVVVGDAWVRLDPFAPLLDKRLLVLDPPHAAGKPWRWLDPDTGEHREHAPVDQAVKRLAGEDPNAPREMSDRPALVGRAAALAVLARAAEEAKDGIRVVLVTGPFGIGRTRLCAAVSEAAAGFGFGRVLEAVCSAERRGPLRALRAALEGREGLERVRDAIAGALSVDVSGGRASVDAFLEAIEEGLVEASLGEATALVVDDAQWADEHTLAVLRLLTERASRKTKGRLLVVAAARDEPNASAALQRFVGQVEADVGSGATRVALEPLDAASAPTLVQGVAPIDRALERAVVAGAGGVPFFLVQPLLVWNETGALVWRDGAWRPVDASLVTRTPPGVRELVRARLGSFFEPGSEAERAAELVLACVALHGSGLGIEHLARATEAAGASTALSERALSALVEAGLLDVRGAHHEYGFAQRVVQEALLELVAPRPWLRRAHRALLDAVASGGDPDDASFLARGYESLGARGEALDWLRRAVDHALAVGAFDEAIEQAGELATSARDGIERANAELSASEALLRAGRAPEARARLERASLGAEPRAAVAARVLRLAIGVYLRDLPADHDSALVADADALGDPALRIESRLAAARLMRNDAALALSQEASTMARGMGPTMEFRAAVLRFDLLVALRPADHAEQARTAADAVAAAKGLGSAWAELTARNVAAVAEMNAGRLSQAIERFREVTSVAAAQCMGSLQRAALVNTAVCHLRARSHAEAATAASTAADHARAAADSRLLAQATSILADALSRQGRWADARAAIDESIAISMAGKDYTSTLALLRRAEIRAEMGDAPGGRSDALLAKQWACAANNTDHATRADLWLLLRDAEDPGASRADLVARVDAAEQVRASLRGPTLSLLDAARQRLG